MFSQRNNPYCELLSTTKVISFPDKKTGDFSPVSMQVFKYKLRNKRLAFSTIGEHPEVYTGLVFLTHPPIINMKKIASFDIGITSIGWAFVYEAEPGDKEPSSIRKLGVRIIPLTTDEQLNFEKGKPVSINAERTLKRSIRRSLQRYKQRRDNLIALLQESGLLTNKTLLAETGKQSTHTTYALRARAATEALTLEEFSRVLLMINKKRGYKSSRKVKNEDEGQIIDGMAIAKRLYEEGLTPGQLCYQLLQEGKRTLPDFYRSDLKAELNSVWQFQATIHPEIFTEAFRETITGKGQKITAISFWNTYGFNTATIKGSREEKKLQAYQWRSVAMHTPLGREEAAYVVAEINNNIHNSSGYLGAISDRSKELYFNKQTVGQYLYTQLRKDPHTRMKNQVFYRQDYFDEFETLWEIQAQHHPVLTKELKEQIRDIIIFYQRKLKSQKGQIAYCELETRQIKVTKAGKVVLQQAGPKVAPKSSPLFQEFKIWQTLSNITLQHKTTKEKLVLSQEDQELLFEELNVKGNLEAPKVLALLGYPAKEWELNYTSVEGNRTHEALITAYFGMMETEGHDPVDWRQLAPAAIHDTLSGFFQSQQIDTGILRFDAHAEGQAFEQQPAYRLWHTLYAYEPDNSPSGNDHLYALLLAKFGFKKTFAQLLANLTLQQDYGSLSTRAMRKIIPYLKEHNYHDARKLAGYSDAGQLTKEENETRPLKNQMELLKKNSLRNPVVEKILNQVVNLMNAIMDDPELGRPDEIRIELARELKKNAKERQEMTDSINKAKAEHEKIRALLIREDGIPNPTRNDIIRYKLYEELKTNGYKTLYSNTYIPREKLFGKEFDVDHIIPQASLFDDSFSNKTLCLRGENLKKGNRTAYDFVAAEGGEEGTAAYLSRLEMMHQAKEGNIGKVKYLKLMKQAKDIGEGFIERDLRNSQYIAKKARQMLLEICRHVVPTTGAITDRLREDWGLVNVMQELNIDKYRKLGLTEQVLQKDGNSKERITDWSKRNDHRHHAMDALTVAFTQHNHIQYLNNLNARKDEQHPKHANIIGIENKITELTRSHDGKQKRIFKSPVADFRAQAKHHLEQVLISFKAKNKVVTKNKNKIKTKHGVSTKIELTPRGQLHKETVYGKIQQQVVREEKVSAKFDAACIARVTVPKYRAALLQRLQDNNNDPKAAFSGKNSLAKNPIYTDADQKNCVPEKVKLVVVESDYTIRKAVTPLNFKDAKSLLKVVDLKVRALLEARLAAHQGNSKEAFADLDKNPIWLNEAKGIAIKSVKISGITNADALHDKRDHFGNIILDHSGKAIAADFISTGNNHHVAIYQDESGNLQEQVVSFYEAVERVNQGLPVIDKTYRQDQGWQLLFTMKQNECFVFPAEGFDPAEIDLLDPANNKQISPHLFRVQKISTKNYFFRHHLETTVEEQPALKGIAYKPQLGLGGIKGIIKVRINHLGQIIKTGEY